MIPYLPPHLYATAALLVTTLGLLLALGVYYRRWSKAKDALLEAELDASTVSGDVGAGEVVDLPPPHLKTGGPFGDVGLRLRVWWHYKKRQRLLGKGYVQWVLVEDGWPQPKFVKPVREGGGIPKVEYDDVSYLFPTSAMLPDEQTGLRTIVHKKGESDPINLEVPNDLAVKVDHLSEYLTTELASEAPNQGWTKKLGLDLTGEQMMWLMILLVIGGSAVMQYLNGGLG